MNKLTMQKSPMMRPAVALIRFGSNALCCAFSILAQSTTFTSQV